MQHPSHRYIQLGIRSLGFDPGKIDGWWGRRTAAAARALLDEGPAKSTPWAFAMLEKGLRGLGYHSGPGTGAWTQGIRLALGALIDADGLPLAAAADPTVILEPTKTPLKVGTHGKVMKQGRAGYTVKTFCLHALAVPGSWWAAKTNDEMREAIIRMHTLPKSQGGRGWSGPGYHAMVCPDGEILELRDEGRIGAGAIGWNRGVYHMVMVEVATIRDTRLPEDFFTADCLASARGRIAEIGARTPLERLMGHREVAAKLCPGFQVIDRDWTDLAVA